MKKRFDIHVLGHEVSVLSDAGDEHVANVVNYINRKADEIEKASKNVPTVNVAILVALNIADELYRLKGEKESIFSQLETKSNDLINYIDRRRSENFPLQCA